MYSIYIVYSVSQGGSHWVCLERYCFSDCWFICFCVTVYYLFKPLHFACMFFPSYWDKKVLGPIEIRVSQRSQPVVLQISNVYGKTLLLNLLNVNEFWLYGYKLQEYLQRDMWLWLFKIYLHRVRYSKITVFNGIEITIVLL